jgi:hypothetical protein
MRLVRAGLRVVAGGIITVALGVSVNQVVNGGRWDPRWLVAAVILAVAAEGTDVWLGTRGHGDSRGEVARPVLWQGLAWADALPLLLGEVTPRDLGVHASRFSAEGDSPYIGRENADEALAAALAGDGPAVVIVEGPRLAGATSTLAQAAQAVLADYLAAGFIDDPRVPLADMIAQASQWAISAAGRAAGAVHGWTG